MKMHITFLKEFLLNLWNMIIYWDFKMEFAQNSIQKIKEKLENIFSVGSLESSTQISDQHTKEKPQYIQVHFYVFIYKLKRGSNNGCV